MTPHDFCRDQLGEFIDQTLDASERAKVAAHLESCPECARFAREMSAIRATLREIKPVPAPPDLRRNVRLALQEQQNARAARAFSWRLPQFAWSGTLAVSAVALLLLARPFDNAPPTESTPVSDSETAILRDETPPAAPDSKAKLSQKAAPNTPKADLKTAKTAPKPRPSKPEATDSQPVNGAGNGASESAKSPSLAAPAPFQAPRGTNRSSDGSSDKISSAPPARASEKKPPSTLAPRTPKSPPQSAASQSAAQPPTPVFRTNPAPETRSPAPAFAPPRAAISASGPRPNAAETRKSAGETGFSFELTRAPAAKTNDQSDDTQTFRGALDANREAPRDTSPVTAESALNDPRREAAPSTRSRAMRPAPSITQPKIQEKTGADTDSATTFAPSPAMSNAPVPAPETARGDGALAGRAQRFDLRLQAPRAVANARVRLEFPTSLRLVFPSQSPVWNGNLEAEKAIVIPISFANGRGGEKISVILEQKMADGESKTLETRILTLPAP